MNCAMLCVRLTRTHLVLQAMLCVRMIQGTPVILGVPHRIHPCVGQVLEAQQKALAKLGMNHIVQYEAHWALINAPAEYPAY